MKVKLLLLTILLLSTVFAKAQQNECYTSRQTQGITMFKKGDYKLAKNYFNFANACPYISQQQKAEVQQWLLLCDDALAGKNVEIPANLDVPKKTQDNEQPVTVEQPKTPVVNKAAERAKREAEERAKREAEERAKREAVERAKREAVEKISKEKTEIVEKVEPQIVPEKIKQPDRFAIAMHTADSCFLAGNYINAEMNYQIAAKEAQKADNQKDVQTAMKKIDCSQQMSQVNDLMNLQKFDDARTKLVLIKSLGCIEQNRVQALIDNCNLKITQANDLLKNNFIAPISEDMVLIKGSVFMMGCQNDCREGETPSHQVVLKNFYMGKHEVTQGQWEAIMGYNPSTVIDKDYPVTNVDYSEIQNFIIKLNAASGLTYRLPTESEWEFAARGGVKSNHTTYAGSNSAQFVAWFSEDSNNEIHAVGLLTPNELDIYDMSGNAAEWCNDWYAPYTAEFHLYPTGAKDGTEHVVRGGGYDDSIDFLRITFRFAAKPDTKSPKIGFRLASDGFEQ